MSFAKDEGDEVYIRTGKGTINEIFVTHTDSTASVRLLGAPGEKGVTEIDHKVRVPDRVRMSGFVTKECFDALTKIESAMETMKLSEALCTVYLRGDELDSMFVSRLTKRGDANKLNGIEIDVEFEEFMGVE